MKRCLMTIAAAAAISACGGQSDDGLGDNAADAAEAHADNLEASAENVGGAQGENLEQQADAVEDRGEAKEEQIDESDVKADELTPEQRNALVNAQ